MNQVKEEQNRCVCMRVREKEREREGRRDREEEEEIWTAGGEEIAFAIAER